MFYILEKKSYSLFYLGSVRKKWRLVLFIDNRPKGCFVSGRFVSTDVLSPRTFCLYGRFVPTDVLSLWMFCPYGRFFPQTLCLRLFCLRTFCLRMFCPYGRLVSGRFVWAPDYGFNGLLIFGFYLGQSGCGHGVGWGGGDCLIGSDHKTINCNCFVVIKLVDCGIYEVLAISLKTIKNVCSTFSRFFVVRTTE